MASAQSPFETAVFDSEQLALKLCMNSFYGVMGASKGYLRCKPAAAAITATGRNMILETKAFVEDKYQAEVIYGVRVSCRLTGSCRTRQSPVAPVPKRT